MRDHLAASCMQHHDSADAGAFVLDEVEARVRKQLLQPARPLIEGNRLQKAGWRVVVNAVAIMLERVQGPLGGVKDHATTIEHDAFIVRPLRSLGEKAAKQLLMFLSD
ncbi:hypothetical protein [Bradyrhizobium altum]|uniref:hypothetical protein n=1 Tax=Bradyrhizobium altum TaxID=1571202 RepID=UPI001E2A11AD|nr:hypothetical protein [Bradyrhizobium altum]